MISPKAVKQIESRSVMNNEGKDFCHEVLPGSSDAGSSTPNRREARKIFPSDRKTSEKI